jgi:predicted amidohydrolase YtcJ
VRVGDVLIRGGVLWSGGSVLPGDAVAVRDGRIVALGAADEVAGHVRAGAEVIDAAGGLVHPGFVDAHVHLGLGAMDALRCDLAGAANVAEIERRIGAFAAGTDAAWVIGGGWDPALFPATGPAATLLDRLVPDRPAFFHDADHHGAWANTRALELAGIRRDLADPTDGRIERTADRTPAGTLREGAVQLVARVLPDPDTDDIARGIVEMAGMLHASGITGWQEAALGRFGGVPDFTDAYRRALAGGTLRGRATGAIWVPRDLDEEGIADFVGAVVDRARENAALGFPTPTAKLMLDGIVESRTAALLEPYAGTGGSGLSYFPPGFVQRLLPALNAAGIAVHVHAIGDRAVRDALDGFARVPPSERARVRNHIAHLQLIHPDDVPRFAALGVTANMQPYWAFATPLLRRTTLPLLGSRASRLYVFASLHRAGASLAMGSDWPVSSVDPWQGISVAVSRRPPGESGAAPLGAGEGIPLSVALDAYTRGSASLLALEGDGMLRVGAPADIGVASVDPFSVADDDLFHTRAVATLVDGEVVFRA